jgi:hypothetical protein
MLNLLAAQYGSISDIEIVWTLIAGIGLAFSIFNVREAFADRAALKLAGVKNGRKMIADEGLLQELARTVIQAIFLTIGLLAMTYPDPPDVSDRPWNLVLIGIVFRWGLIISASLIMLKSFGAWRLRRRLNDIQAKTLVAGPTTTEVTGQITVTPTDDDSASIVATLEGEGLVEGSSKPEG